MTETRLPETWDPGKVQRVLAYYEGQSDNEAAHEDEVAFASITHTAMEVRVELVPEVRELIAKHGERSA